MYLFHIQNTFIPSLEYRMISLTSRFSFCSMSPLLHPANMWRWAEYRNSRSTNLRYYPVPINKGETFQVLAWVQVFIFITTEGHFGESHRYVEKYFNNRGEYVKLHGYEISERSIWGFCLYIWRHLAAGRCTCKCTGLTELAVEEKCQVLENQNQTCCVDALLGSGRDNNEMPPVVSMHTARLYQHSFGELKNVHVFSQTSTHVSDKNH